MVLSHTEDYSKNQSAWNFASQVPIDDSESVLFTICLYLLFLRCCWPVTFPVMNGCSAWTFLNRRSPISRLRTLMERYSGSVVGAEPPSTAFASASWRSEGLCPSEIAAEGLLLAPCCNTHTTTQHHRGQPTCLYELISHTFARSPCHLKEQSLKSERFQHLMLLFVRHEFRQQTLHCAGCKHALAIPENSTSHLAKESRNHRPPVSCNTRAFCDWPHFEWTTHFGVQIHIHYWDGTWQKLKPGWNIWFDSWLSHKNLVPTRWSILQSEQGIPISALMGTSLTIM